MLETPFDRDEESLFKALIMFLIKVGCCLFVELKYYCCSEDPEVGLRGGLRLALGCSSSSSENVLSMETP